MFEKTLAEPTRQVWEKLSKAELVGERFYLAGGTALAMHLGHRVSVDLDFFTDKYPPISTLLSVLADLGFKVLMQDLNSIDGEVDGVKVSFLEYRYPLLEPLTTWNGIGVASIRDIASMKLATIASRGSRKDFVDLWKLLKEKGLEELIADFKKKFVGVDYSLVHLKKSLVYFVDADEEEMPRMLVDCDWEEVKRELERVVLTEA